LMKEKKGEDHFQVSSPLILPRLSTQKLFRV
jgi:hypothetical protein